MCPCPSNYTLGLVIFFYNQNQNSVLLFSPYFYQLEKQEWKIRGILGIKKKLLERIIVSQVHNRGEKGEGVWFQKKEIGIIAIKGKTFQKCLIQEYRSGPTHCLILLFHSPMRFSHFVNITTLTSSARALQFLIFLRILVTPTLSAGTSLLFLSKVLLLFF